MSKFDNILNIFIWIVLLIFFIYGVTYSQVSLTKEQQEQLINRLERDKQLLIQDKNRWEKIRKETPKIEWEVKDNYFILQKMQIEVYNDTPLIYETEWKIDLDKKEDSFFPMTLRFAGTIESSMTTDFKIGLKVISLSPLKSEMINNLGLNVLVGLKSSGLSISYDMGKPFSNVAFHLYSGFKYSLSNPSVFGIGISVNF